MDLKKLKVNEITNLDEYKHMFGNIPFYEDENNKLHVNEGTMFHYSEEAEICNRRNILNYLDIIGLLFNKYDYFEIEIRTQLGILDSMLREVMSYYDPLYAEVHEYTKSKSGNWAQDFADDEDYRYNSSRLGELERIKRPLEELCTALENKLSDGLKK